QCSPGPSSDEAGALATDVHVPHSLAWMGEHLPEWRQQASRQRPLYWILGIGFVVGLAAQIGGFVVKTSVTTEPLLLLADLLYALGWSLWTGVVVVFFVQTWPEAKRRQLKRSLDAYEAALREKARAGGDQASGTTERRRRGSGQAERPAGGTSPPGGLDRRASRCHLGRPRDPGRWLARRLKRRVPVASAPNRPSTRRGGESRTPQGRSRCVPWTRGRAAGRSPS